MLMTKILSYFHNPATRETLASAFCLRARASRTFLRSHYVLAFSLKWTQ